MRELVSDEMWAVVEPLLPEEPAVLAVLLFMLVAGLQVRSEERTLAAALGEPYRAYLARVPRWLGRPRGSPVP